MGAESRVSEIGDGWDVAKTPALLGRVRSSYFVCHWQQLLRRELEALGQVATVDNLGKLPLPLDLRRCSELAGMREYRPGTFINGQRFVEKERRA
jgi:hypothetical protein